MGWQNGKVQPFAPLLSLGKGMQKSLFHKIHSLISDKQKLSAGSEATQSVASRGGEHWCAQSSSHAVTKYYLLRKHRRPW